MPKDAFSRLLDDEDSLTPPSDLPAWETYGNWYMMVTPKGIACVVIPPGQQGFGIVRFPDRSSVPIPPGSDRDILEAAESILHEGPPVWDRLDRDYLDPAREEKPKTTAPDPVYTETTPREAPHRRGPKEAFPWNFKKT